MPGATPSPAARSVAEPAGEAAILCDQTARLGVELTVRKAEQLLSFRDLVVRWNATFNLVSRRDMGRLLPRHLLDSLTVMPWLVGTEVLDVGTGAGFPGVPLAITREDVHFTLIDLSERKVRFVERTVRILGLANVTALCADVRTLTAESVFATVVCRGVAHPAAAWTLAGARVAPGGRMVIMSRTRPPAEPDADPHLPGDAWLEGRHRVRVPGLLHPHELTLLCRHEAGTPRGHGH